MVAKATMHILYNLGLTGKDVPGLTFRKFSLEVEPGPQVYDYTQITTKKMSFVHFVRFRV